jgi:Fe-S cluster assembly protein SufD
VSPVATPFPFAANERTLAAVLDELEDLGSHGGGATPFEQRRDALAAYVRLAGARRDDPPRWRHGDAAQRFEDLVWTSGRLPVAGRAGGATTLGLVHAGSVNLAERGPQNMPRGLRIATLADAVRARSAAPALRGTLIAPDADAFVALATAFANCGACVEVPAGLQLDSAIQLVWTTAPGEAQAVFPQTVVRLGAGARATILERHLGESDGFLAGTVEIELDEGAHLDYIVVSLVDGGARTALRRAARCARGATMRWHLAELGGALSRSFVATELAGGGATGDASVLFFARNFEHVDACVEVVHSAERTRSRSIVRAAASGRGQVRFGGTVTARRGAGHASASYRQDALVLSRDAYVDGRPVLDVDAANAFVSHAASIGGLDQDELFYVQSRGIARGAAEHMIALAFFEPAIVNFPTDALRDEVRTALDEELDEVADTFSA